MKTSTKMRISNILIDLTSLAVSLVVSVIFINVFLYLLSNLIPN